MPDRLSPEAECELQHDKITDELETCACKLPGSILEALVAVRDDGHIIFDPAGNVTYISELASTMLRRKLYTPPLTIASLDFEPLYNLFHQALENPDAIHSADVDLPYSGDAGEIRVKAGLSRSGEIEGVVATLHDKRNELDLDRMKSDFLSAVSHELRTPLTSIIGYSNLLFEAGDSITEDDRRQFLRTIETQGRVLLELINDLIVISKLEAHFVEMQMEPYAVSKLLQSLASDYASEAAGAGVMLSVDIDERPLNASCDPTQLQQALGYLLDNAIKFTPAGGDVTLRCYCGGDNVVIEVSDTGIGVAPEHKQYLFEKFYQVDGTAARKANGTGLGLAIVKGIVDYHGGEVFVESEPGLGSTFGFTLPMCDSASVSQAA